MNKNVSIDYKYLNPSNIEEEELEKLKYELV